MSTSIIIPTDLASAVERAMLPDVRAALNIVRSIARAAGMPCYLVGGPVRDLLLGQEIDDLDMVFEGNALSIADQCAALVGGDLVRHEAFGTAKLLFEQAARPFHVDFITARRETYPTPASLPVVEPASLADDLLRRDFTINTLAIRLDDSPVLIDQLGGIPDLEHGIIRVLHDRSFIDDPTRILRGTRFAARLGFAFEPHTTTLVREAVDMGMIEATTPVRILNEVWLSYREPAPERVFAILADLGVLSHVFQGLEWRPEIATAFAKARHTYPAGEARRLVLLCLSVWWLDAEQRQALLRWYSFSSDERRRIAELDALHRFLDTADAATLPMSALDRSLRDFTDTALQVGMMVAPPPIREAIATYERMLRPTRTLLDGNDLRALGVAPGPRYRVLLEGLRAAQLDGDVTNRDEAMDWVRREQQNTL